MVSDKITEETICTLVDLFYTKIRADKTLGKVFTRVIGETDEAWKPHLQRMYDFWSSVMLSTGRYRGNPIQKHKDIPAFESDLFDRWLTLFAETAREVHTDNIADHYIEKSQRIAQSLKFGLYYKAEKQQNKNSS